MNATELTYRRTAAEGASGFGLLIALYDTLAGNLRRAAEAQRNRDLERRAREISHALLVVGYLEDWIDRQSGGELATKLITFYSTMRRTLIQAQISQSPEILEQQMDLVLSIRGTWQDLESRAASALAPPSPPVSISPPYPGAMPPEEDVRTVSSWSA